jgi:hypothetical protein
LAGHTLHGQKSHQALDRTVFVEGQIRTRHLGVPFSRECSSVLWTDGALAPALAAPMAAWYSILVEPHPAFAIAGAEQPLRRAGKSSP